MKLSIIVAVADDLAIGKSQSLLCHIPGDLKRFKSLTLSHTVIMGRKTFLTLPGGPLKERRNIIITRDPKFRPDGCEVAPSVQQALSLASNEDEVFIIGGGEIYRQTIDRADSLYLTQIHASFPDADTFFPQYTLDNYTETFREDHEPSEKCPYPFSFVNLDRKK